MSTRRTPVDAPDGANALAALDTTIATIEGNLTGLRLIRRSMVGLPTPTIPAGRPPMWTVHVPGASTSLSMPSTMTIDEVRDALTDAGYTNLGEGILWREDGTIRFSRADDIEAEPAEVIPRRRRMSAAARRNISRGRKAYFRRQRRQQEQG